MLTRRTDGNISGEATTQSGNIYPEAMRTLCGTRSGTRRQAAARCVAHKARKTLGQSATEGGGTPLVLYEQLLRFLTPTRG